MKRLNKKKLMRGELSVDRKIWTKRVMEGTYYGYNPRMPRDTEENQEKFKLVGICVQILIGHPLQSGNDYRATSSTKKQHRNLIYPNVSINWFNNMITDILGRCLKDRQLNK